MERAANALVTLFVGFTYAFKAHVTVIQSLAKFIVIEIRRQNKWVGIDSPIHSRLFDIFCVLKDQTYENQ